MAKTYPELSFMEKAIYHVRKAEEWQAKAERLENLADERTGDDQLSALRLVKDDDLAFPYRQATANRNSHQQRVIMYSLLALMEKAYH
jgi:hypothetical protein